MNRPLSAIAIALVLAATSTSASDTETDPTVVADADVPRPVVSEVLQSQAGIARSWVGSIEAEHEISLGFLVLGTLAQRPADLGNVVS
ncbi:MAG: hypothetical protein CML65_19905, partial [Rhodobacteraceae bacterium]|nr:hypothetical protein [Paracoccaceae bacterium]